MSRPRKSISKTRKSTTRKRKSRNSSNIITNRSSNINYPTGGKTHINSKTKRHIKPSGKTISITNSYMNKKGIIRHIRTKEIHPYVAVI
jgi:hypothetical protein